MLPILFMLFTGLALAGAMFALWQSMRAAFGNADATALQEVIESEELTELLDAKRAILNSIKDLQFDRQVGKISEEDFKGLDRKLRAQVRSVMTSLDERAAPFRAKAEALLAQQVPSLSESSTKMDSRPAPNLNDRHQTEGAPPDAARADADSRVDCPTCGTANEVDAAFCKACAAPMSGGADDKGSSA